MTRHARLKRQAGNAFLAAMAAALLAPAAFILAWLLLPFAPAAGIGSGLVAFACVAIGIVQGREAVRLFNHADAEDLRRLQLPQL
jgi:hypothetical protein